MGEQRLAAGLALRMTRAGGMKPRRESLAQLHDGGVMVPRAPPDADPSRLLKNCFAARLQASSVAHPRSK